MSNLAFDFQPSVPTLDVSTLAPYDVHIAVNGQIIELTASTRPGAPGGDFLRLFYKRAFSPENMQVNNDAANSVITISVSSANIAVMHSLAEIYPNYFTNGEACWGYERIFIQSSHGKLLHSMSRTAKNATRHHISTLFR